MTDLTSLTLAQARDALRRREFSATELAEAHLAAIEKARALNAFVLETPDRAREMARLADARLAQGEGGPLAGLPLGVKDVFCTADVHDRLLAHPRQFCSGLRVDGDRKPLGDGAFARQDQQRRVCMGSSNETSHFGPVVSPRRRRGSDAKLVPGGPRAVRRGSSRQLCGGAVGTDTGGSIRQPAAFCGVVGMRPTYGRCSRGASWSTFLPIRPNRLRAPSATARCCCARWLGLTARIRPALNVRCPITNGPSALRSKACDGIPKEYRTPGMASEIEDLWQRGAQWLKDAGARSPAYRCRTPNTRWPRTTSSPCGSVIQSRPLRRRALRAAVPGRDVIEMYERTRRRLRQGCAAHHDRTYVLSAGYYDAYYLRAQQVRTLIKRDFEECFAGGIDAVLTPTTPSAAFAIGEKGRADPVEMYLNDVFTVTVNLAGLPGISVPSGLDAQGLPLGLQLIGRPFAEETLFALGAVIEQAAGSFASDPWWRSANL
jgi:aspartyl-tRNA(Asn)/glutamyl-tRNA(Gln) amidotransferase subunit A